MEKRYGQFEQVNGGVVNDARDERDAANLDLLRERVAHGETQMLMRNLQAEVTRLTRDQNNLAREEAKKMLTNAGWTHPGASTIPTVLFSGHTVYRALTQQQQGRTSPENVSDVLDAVVTILRVEGRTKPPTEAPEASGAG